MDTPIAQEPTNVYTVGARRLCEAFLTRDLNADERATALATLAADLAPKIQAYVDKPNQNLFFLKFSADRRQDIGDDAQRMVDRAFAVLEYGPVRPESGFYLINISSHSVWEQMPGGEYTCLFIDGQFTEEGLTAIAATNTQDARPQIVGKLDLPVASGDGIDRIKNV